MVQTEGKELECAIFTPPQGVKRKVPKWLATVLYTKDGKIVFIPMKLLGNPNMIYMMASYDGASIATYGSHLFVDLAWAEREYGDRDGAMNAFTTCREKVKTLVAAK